MRLLGRRWQKSLTGAYGEPPAMPVGPLFVLISVLREVLFEIVYSESHGVASERFAHMGRIGLLETSGAQVAAEQGTEAGRKTFGKTVGYLHHILFLHSAGSRTYAYEHKSAFHKAALGAEASATVQAYG